MQALLNVWFFVEILLGIGFLIFVHELGHFLFAKRHGVRVETFSLGFGKRLWGFKRGDTDYRVSLIPLGGYVKMAGENPEEVRTGAPWELASKGVWARFEIFVAGTAMNFVWSFPIMAAAFLVGKEAAAPLVGEVRPDSPEWASELQVGDELVSVGGQKVHAYEDYVKAVVRRPKGERLEIEFRRGGELRRTTVEVGFAKQIGMSPVSTVVAEVEKDKAADKSGLRKGDEIVSIDGVPVFEASEIAGIIDRSAGQELSVVVRDRAGRERTLRIVPALGDERFTLGIGGETTPAAVGTVRPGSPADKAGLRPGDVFVSVAGTPTPNFFAMTSLVRQLAARDVEVVWRRGDETKSATVRVGSQGGRGFLGVTPEVSNTLATIPADSALAKAGLQAGDRILSVDGKEVRAVSSPTADENARAARGDLFLSLGQIENAVRAGKGDAVELGVKRGDESLKLAVTPDKKGDGDLGIRLQHKTLMLRTGFVESVKRGCAEAMDVFVLTFQMLRKLVVREEEASNLSGPVGIMSASYKSAKEGLGNLLWLLGLISMNLAVINLLPIPILDGGHIMFLVVEKLRGKPVSEKVLMRAQVVGLLMLLSLVVFVTFHDVKRLFL